MNEDKATRYHRLRRRAAVASVLVQTGLLVVLLASGAARTLARASERVAADTGLDGALATAVAVLILVGGLVILADLLSLPLDCYSGYWLERRYGLSIQRASAWLADRVKSLLIGLIITSVGALAVQVSMHLMPTWWWLAASALASVVVVLMVQLAPILLYPLFFEFRPMARAELRDRLVRLSARVGVPVVDAFEWSLSAKSKKANAALAGLGPTRRILVSDTMLGQYEDDEIEVVLAHELGHHVHRDVWIGIAMEVALITLGCYVADRTLGALSPLLGVSARHDPALLPLIALVFGLMAIVSAPAVNGVSRALERRADRFAMTRNPQAFERAMRRLAAQNLSEEHPSRLARFFLLSHPPLAERIEMARRQGPSQA
jgi:STE24 endopeptidase